MSRRLTVIVLMAIAAIIAAACTTSGGATASPPAAATASPSAASVAPSESASASASEAPSESASAAAEATVEVTQLKDFGPALYGGESGLTVYTFTKDVKDSGKSNCTGGCLATWPALTVAAGETPSAGEGVTGKLGTITREDDGTLQVTYNGLPLYFFKNDKAEGDANGIYENWNAVKP
jgi:predicted lipoprotein with Yx(FWY)xxD motif